MRAVPTEPQANSRGNQVLREADAAALFAAVRTDAPLPAADRAADPATPTDVTADVLNASGRDGARRGGGGHPGRARLPHGGGHATRRQPALDTLVRFSPDRAEQAQLLATAVPVGQPGARPGRHRRAAARARPVVRRRVRAATAPEPVADTATAPAATCG